MRAWRHHLFYRTTSLKTTWKLRLAALVVVILAGLVTRGFWVTQIGRSLVCVEDLGRTDLMLIENFNPEYILFERAAALEQAGVAPRALVPVQASDDPKVPNPVSTGIAELMARHARLKHWSMVSIREVEPIRLNAANQVRDHLTGGHIKSMTVVTSGLNSRRSTLVYRAVLGQDGPRVACAPVFGPTTPEHWADTWHGVQEVAEEFMKLQYYRSLPGPALERSRATRGGDALPPRAARRRDPRQPPLARRLPARRAGRRGRLSPGRGHGREVVRRRLPELGRRDAQSPRRDAQLRPREAIRQHQLVRRLHQP
jgi:hypothetical protein